jgi:hypothetical protein
VHKFVCNIQVFHTILFDNKVLLIHLSSRDSYKLNLLIVYWAKEIGCEIHRDHLVLCSDH